jgi:rubrerythrin
MNIFRDDNFPRIILICEKCGYKERKHNTKDYKYVCPKCNTNLSIDIEKK